MNRPAICLRRQPCLRACSGNALAARNPDLPSWRLSRQMRVGRTLVIAWLRVPESSASAADFYDTWLTCRNAGTGRFASQALNAEK